MKIDILLWKSGDHEVLDYNCRKNLKSTLFVYFLNDLLFLHLKILLFFHIFHFFCKSSTINANTIPCILAVDAASLDGPMNIPTLLYLHHTYNH